MVFQLEKGNMRMVRTHMEGLKRMTDLRGGLNSMRRSNAMVANFVFCTYVATMVEDFPIADLLSGIQEPDWYHEAQLKFSNPEYVHFEDCGVHEDLAHPLRMLRLLAAMDQSIADDQDTVKQPSMLSLLCSNLQRILSLPSVGPHQSKVFCMAEACRSAAAIHVLWRWKGRIPDSTMMVSKSQHLLRISLSSLMRPGTSDPVLLWLLSTGAVGALGAPERIWYVGHLTAVMQELSISTYEHFKATLKRVIWLERQDEPTHVVLWQETVRCAEEMDS